MKKKPIFRLAGLLILVTLLVGTSLAVQAGAGLPPSASGSGSSSTSSVTFTPSADAYVIQTSASTNYGSGVSLRVDSTPVTHSFLRFVISGLNGATVQSAMLRIYANSANSIGFSILAVSNNTWVETGITFTNAPAVGIMITSSKAFTAGSWVVLDVSSYIKAAGTFSLAITTTSTTNTNLASSRDSTHAPQLVISTSGGSGGPTPTLQPTPPPTGGSGNVLLMAGDICKHNFGLVDYTANCKNTGDQVRSVLAANPGAEVQTLGDNVNNDGGTYSYVAEYQDLYAPNWGSFMNVTHALMGNHDTYPPGGDAAYFAYFKSTAGPQPGGYYSYNIGSSWHVIVLNAQCSKAGGCAATSPQTLWLQSDLASNTRQCVLAVWHQPRFTSGRHPNDSTYAPWWNLLYQYKADIVAGGHNHNYERFDQINAQEQAASDGIREFVVGTGGAPGDGYTYASHPLQPNEAVRNQTVQYGVLKLTLSASSYSWSFLPAAGSTFTDSGSTVCH